ncbi:MAG: AMP-binding protein [Burkholderiaceae bacterium]|nr:AMP-binding protein [Burkholderiaceae bacterium]MEB2352331.1 AMP-binding protein [Burkholderiaceae bacterium]
MQPPGGVPSAHVDPFIRSQLPPQERWPRFDYSAAHLNHYPDRLNASVTLLDAAIAAGAGDKPVFHYEDITWTYGHLLDRVQRIARVLVEDLGFVPGERVLLRSANTPMVAACWLAVLRAGGVVINTMAMLRARELGFILDKAQVRFALCEVSLAEELSLAASSVSLPGRIAYFTPACDASHPDADLDRCVAAKPAGGGAVATAADDVALVSFTSGTTGHPKGAAAFHRDLVAAADCWPKVYTVEPGDVVVGSPTLAFTYGLGASLLYPLRYRATSVLIPQPTPEALLGAVARHRATSLYSVPALYQSMLPLVEAYDLSSLRKCASAGENLRATLWEQWHAATGLRAVNGLGTTEMLTHFVSESMKVDCVGSMGRTVPGYTVELLDDTGVPVRRGERGRLAVIGPTGCRYIGDPERQRMAVQHGWNLTGDICDRDEDGCFWYVDRADDMIVSAGYNISPQEVERVVAEHPGVAACAVVGVPHETRGNVVRACVVLRDPRDATDATAGEIQQYVKSVLAPYKYPREVKFVDELPRTATGKVQRYRLRDL